MINEAINRAPSMYYLPDGRIVEFASPEHISHVQQTLEALVALRDRQPRAGQGRPRAASREIYGRAVQELRLELKDAMKFANCLEEVEDVPDEDVVVENQ